MTKLKRSGILFCLIGPTGGGKTTLAEHLLKTFPQDVSFSVSCTSRKPRDYEIDAKHYYFISRAEFEKRIAAGLFFEYEEVHGNLYGTLSETLNQSLNAGKDLLLDVDIVGALNIKKHYPENTVIIFTAAPNYETIVSRIKLRADISEEEINRRILTAKLEYKLLLENRGKIDYFIVNENLEVSKEIIADILIVERNSLKRIDFSTLQTICELRN